MLGKQNATQVLYILHVQVGDVRYVQCQISPSTLQAHVHLMFLFFNEMKKIIFSPFCDDLDIKNLGMLPSLACFRCDT